MYMPTRFSGNLPKFLEIECKDPFSQYLIERCVSDLWRLDENYITYSKMIFSDSADLTKPRYLTMFGC